MVDWSAIDTVLLDMDGTLLDLHFDNYFWLEHLPRCYASHVGCDVTEASRLLTGLSESLHGSLDWYCLDYWSAWTGLDIEALKHEVRHLIRYRPGTPEFLAFLQKEGKQMLLVTNAHPRALRLKLQASGLDRHLHSFVSSHELQLAKENPGFWQRLKEHANLDLGRCLFIDDSLNVLRCARAEGLQHTLQILQPDTTLAPRAASEFPGILHFSELMPA
jgi:putative hydrolase of the HAD superfamily